jgi:lactate dehydrogenase-like 2-hydroxyacid dehydrogenase
MTHPALLQVGPLPAWDEGPLAEAFTVRRLFDAPDSEAFLARVGPEVRAIATRGDLGAPRAMIEACPRLEIVSVYGVGFDAVDLDACRARGVRVTNTPDVLTDDVADLAVAMTLALHRGVLTGEAWVRSGDWAAKGMHPLTRRVGGRRAGVLGLGRIGRAVADRLAAFGMEIGYAATAEKATPGWTYLPDPLALARWADVLVVTLTATPATRRIVGRAVIEAVGPEGMIVNVSRAANLDEDALIAALESGALGGAALDVFEGEPNINPRMLTAPNLLLQPHHGSGTVETRRDMGRLMRENLAAHFAGRPLPTPVL